MSNGGRNLRLKNSLSLAQSGKCALCGGRMINKQTITIDHVLPKTLGGKNVGNRLAVHRVCNTHKGGRMPKACELLLLEAVNLRVLA